MKRPSYIILQQICFLVMFAFSVFDYYYY